MPAGWFETSDDGTGSKCASRSMLIAAALVFPTTFGTGRYPAE